MDLQDSVERLLPRGVRLRDLARLEGALLRSSLGEGWALFLVEDLPLREGDFFLVAFATAGLAVAFSRSSSLGRLPEE